MTVPVAAEGDTVAVSVTLVPVVTVELESASDVVVDVAELLEELFVVTLEQPARVRRAKAMQGASSLDVRADKSILRSPSTS
ncbi:MAG TPA: hypothetical protein VN151_04415 [Terracidiphilus sp.]|nr:hypothetical protein [Terracidiphilus sp.]